MGGALFDVFWDTVFAEAAVRLTDWVVAIVGNEMKVVEAVDAADVEFWAS